VEHVLWGFMKIVLILKVICSCNDCKEIWVCALLCLQGISRWNIAVWLFIGDYGKITKFPSCSIMIFVFKCYNTLLRKQVVMRT
jgi:hypothetical protein